MRLIDADALERKITKEKNAVVSRDTYGIGYNDGMAMAYALAVMSPTIDAVPVVRCKDCVWCEQGKSYEPYCNHPTDGMYDVQRDDFCSYGGRRTSDD